MGELKSTLHRDLKSSIEVRLIVIPGNHDCNFYGPTDVRETVLEGIRANPEKASNTEMIRTCTAIQDNFFSYLETLDDKHLNLCNRLYYEYPFTVGRYKLLFRCYNTAWISERSEKQGELLYPLDHVQGSSEGFDLVVSVFHHPYQWLEHQNARRFREHIESTSDIVLTGHEHDQTRHTQTSAEGQRNQYIEGGVLQESHDSSVSSINCLILDIAGKRQRFFYFVWKDDGLYHISPRTTGQWEELQVNKLLTRRSFETNTQFRRLLEDPEATLIHPDRDSLQLSDVYIYPDLREEARREKVPRLIKSDEILDNITERQKVMITGPEASGKTALAKTLFTDLMKRGFVPVLIDGAAFKVRLDDTLYTQIEQLFEEQYSRKLLDKYKQLKRSDRMMIVDNFDELNLRNRNAIDQFLTMLGNFSENYVVLADSHAQHLRDVAGDDSLSTSLTKVPRFKIQEFGYALREILG